MTWTLVLWYISTTAIGTAVIPHMTHEQCKQQALQYLNNPKLPIVATCVQTQETK